MGHHGNCLVYVLSKLYIWKALKELPKICINTQNGNKKTKSRDCLSMKLFLLLSVFFEWMWLEVFIFWTTLF